MSPSSNPAKLRVSQAPVQADAVLRSTPETILWGYIAANLPPALSIRSGQIVEVEALSHQGLTTAKDPEKFFAGYGIPSGEVLADAKTVFAQAVRPKGASVHILTGPIYIEEAEAGDTILLSPACASFDQFRDFEARGDAFRALVGEL